MVAAPLAAALMGLLRVVWEVADSVSSWAVRLVFSPVVWAGVVVAGVSVVLFVVSVSCAGRRSPPGPNGGPPGPGTNPRP